MIEAFRVSTDPAELDRDWVHRALSTQSTWAIGIPRETMDRAIDHSLCFAGFVGGRQVAFARVVTDQATIANLVDVFVDPAHRGKGYSKALVAAVVGDPRLAGLRRFLLNTNDAHGLYAQYGWKPVAKPETAMERWDPDVYVRK